MRSNYKKLGPYIQEINIRNLDLSVDRLLGVSIKKILMSSIANTIGTDMTKYKVVRKNQFAYGPVTSRNGDKISIALLQEYEAAIISQSYKVFEIIDHDELLPEYLMMWFRRPEFDRYARFMSHGSTRETFDWEEMYEVELPIPSIDKQREIVKEYNTIVNRITLNEQLNQKLEETAQALYKHWFVDFNFPITKESYPELVSRLPDVEGKPYKSSGGNMEYNEELDQEIPESFNVKNLCEITNIIMGQSPNGDSYNQDGIGEIFYQGRTDFGFRIPEARMYTSEPKRKAKKGDVLMSVRAPVGDLNISIENCCIGRGLASIRSCENSYVFYVMKNFKQLFDSNKGTGTIFSSINKDELYNLKISYNENISKLYNELVEKCDDQILTNSLQNQKLIEFKYLILSKMTKVEIEKEIKY